MKISPCMLLPAWLPSCLPVRPTKGPTTRAPLPRRHRAAATWPVLLLLRPLPPSSAPLVRRRVTACLQPASCANFILHTTAPRSHYIAWLGLLQKKTNDGRSCTDSSEPFSFTLLRLQLWEGKKNRHVVVEARKTTIFAHLPSIGLYLSRRPRPMPPPHGKHPAAPPCADDV